MLAIDVADACGKSLAIAAAMSFSKFQGAMCPKGMSEIQQTIFNHHALRLGYVQHPCEENRPLLAAWARWSPGEGGMTVKPKNRAPRIYLGIFFAIFVAPALAHDPSHPELNIWFNRLASGRGLCCSLTDGVTVADPDWESREGHYRVRLYGEWIDVPDDALITEPNRAGQTMVWPMLFNGEISVRCFMPGSMT